MLVLWFGFPDEYIGVCASWGLCDNVLLVAILLTGL
jgi:hypothetical protein